MINSVFQTATVANFLTGLLIGLIWGFIMGVRMERKNKHIETYTPPDMDVDITGVRDAARKHGYKLIRDKRFKMLPVQKIA